MPKFKNALDELLTETVLASGVDRQVKFTEVRNYLRSKPTDQIKAEIAVITSLQELRMLQAAGIDAAFQDTFLFTYQKLSTF